MTIINFKYTPCQLPEEAATSSVYSWGSIPVCWYLVLRDDVQAPAAAG